ncbi:MAG: class I SAM-dependent methyltransferase [Rhodospirillales bacterium]|nr:class I SAM-dependent methyltransferase [Rhodospirillales bacterium]
MADIPYLSARVREAEALLRTAIKELVTATNNPYIPFAPSIEQELLDECRVLRSRYTLLEFMPKNAVCAEVGTRFGHFAKEIRKKTSPAKFHIIDIDLQLFEREEFDGDIQGGRVHLHEGDSSTILNSFTENYFDWIYIDAQHSYEGFVKDLNASVKKLKPDGFIVCNDYTVYSAPEVYHYGVLRGVNEFCTTHRWKMSFLR